MNNPNIIDKDSLLDLKTKFQNWSGFYFTAEIFESGNNYHPENRVMYDRIVEEWQQAQQELWTNPVILLKQD